MPVHIVDLGKVPRGWRPMEVRDFNLGSQSPLELAIYIAEAMGKEIVNGHGYDSTLVHRFGTHIDIQKTQVPYSERIVGISVSLYSL